jgi:ABC-type uncharacterized transport system auxiliary subunit
MLSMVLIFSACSSKKAQTKKYFRLAAVEPTTLQTDNKRPLTLVVKRPKALSILGGRPIVATQADSSLVQLSHNFWLESPKVLLQDRIRQWAENHWQTVSYQTPSNQPHQILESRILAFEKNQDQATATMEFSLYDEDSQLLFSQQFNATENITEDNYRAFVKALSLAVENIFAQLSAQL